MRLCGKWQLACIKVKWRIKLRVCGRLQLHIFLLWWHLGSPKMVRSFVISCLWIWEWITNNTRYSSHATLCNNTARIQNYGHVQLGPHIFWINYETATDLLVIALPRISNNAFQSHVFYIRHHAKLDDCKNLLSKNHHQISTIRMYF